MTQAYRRRGPSPRINPIRQTIHDPERGEAPAARHQRNPIDWVSLAAALEEAAFTADSFLIR
jgi:hypothetical protein